MTIISRRGRPHGNIWYRYWSATVVKQINKNVIFSSRVPFYWKIFSIFNWLFASMYFFSIVLQGVEGPAYKFLLADEAYPIKRYIMRT